MMDYETQGYHHGGSPEPVSWSCIVTVDHFRLFTGAGPTEAAAIIDALAKAAVENDEARAELGVMLGVRGDGKGGRPVGT